MVDRIKPALITVFADLLGLRADPANAELCLSLQERLIRQITAVEARLRSAKERQRAWKQRLATPMAADGDRSAARLAAQSYRRNMQRNEALAKDYADLLFILRAVGDGIAFIYLSKWDVKPLAFRERPGFLSGKTGSRVERRLLRQALRSGRIAILNDLTNSLRYGDVTIPTDEAPLIVEVKSAAPRGGRVRRQAEGLRQIGDYFATDRAEGLFGLPGQFRRVASGVEEVDHSEAMTTLAVRALSGQPVHQEVEPGLHYIATSAFDPDAVERVLGGCRGKPLIAMANEYKFAEEGYLPFTLSLRDPEALYAFYKGRIVLCVVADSALLVEHFASRGYTVELDFNDERPLRVTKPQWTERGLAPASVGIHIVRRLVTEFASLRWLCESTVDFTERAMAEYGPDVADV